MGTRSFWLSDGFLLALWLSRSRPQNRVTSYYTTALSSNEIKQANNYISSPPRRPGHVRAAEVQRDLVRVDDAAQ